MFPSISRGLRAIRYRSARVLQKLRLSSPRLRIDLVWEKSPSVLVGMIGGAVLHPPPTQSEQLIGNRIRKTDVVGSLPLWPEYQQTADYRSELGSTRAPSQVSIGPDTGRFFADLVRATRPDLCVEFGTAFGVSGMYWLAGLEDIGHGRLLTFEPNEVWAEIAKNNLAAVSKRFELVVGTFEENIASHIRQDERIGIAFIDAIHTCEFVSAQFEIVIKYLAPGGIVVIDDIGFSRDMQECWKRIARDPRVLASATLGRLGVLETFQTEGGTGSPR